MIIRTKKNTFFILLALVCLFLIYLLPVSSSIRFAGDIELTKAGKTAISVLAFALILWLTEAVPVQIRWLSDS